MRTRYKKNITNITLFLILGNCVAVIAFVFVCLAIHLPICTTYCISVMCVYLFCLYSFFSSRFFILYVNVINPLIKKIKYRKKKQEKKDHFLSRFLLSLSQYLPPFFDRYRWVSSWQWWMSGCLREYVRRILLWVFGSRVEPGAR